jgi:hypothetical protein
MFTYYCASCDGLNPDKFGLKLTERSRSPSGVKGVERYIVKNSSLNPYAPDLRSPDPCGSHPAIVVFTFAISGSLLYSFY